MQVNEVRLMGWAPLNQLCPVIVSKRNGHGFHQLHYDPSKFPINQFGLIDNVCVTDCVNMQ